MDNLDMVQSGLETYQVTLQDWIKLVDQRLEELESRNKARLQIEQELD